MSTALRRRPVRRALVAAAAVAAGALGVVPAAPATAAQTGQPEPGTGTVVWEISQMLGVARDHLMAPQPARYGAPATYDAPLSSWGNGSGTVAADGSADLTFQGSSYLLATDSGGWLQLADLGFDIQADGSGTVTADVTYGSGGTTATPTTQRVGTDLPVVDLSVDPGNPGGTEDVKYPASYDALTYAFGTTPSAYTWSNLRGRWSSQLLSFLAGDASAQPAVPGFSFASLVANTVDSSSRIRYPAPFTISLDRAVAATSSTLGAATPAGASLAVTGSGFTKTFPGIYASIRTSAPGDPAYAGGSVAADAPTIWASNDAADLDSTNPLGAANAVIGEDGAFAAAMALSPAFIESYDPEKVYTLVTRKAHGMGTQPAHADQISETPLDLSGLAALAAARQLTSVTASTTPSEYGHPAAVKVTVAGEDTAPTGAVTVKKGDTVVGTGTVQGGTATVPVSGLAVGEHALTVEYAGGSDFWASSGATSATVTKATTVASITAPARAAYGRAVTVKVTVPGATGPVSLAGVGAKRTGTLAAGVATFVLPATTAVGGYTLTATYAGDDNHVGDSATARLTVAKAATRTAVRVAPRPTAKKAGKAAVTVAGATGGKVVVTIKGAGRTVVKSVRLNVRGKAVVALPRAAKGGSFVVTVRYAGDANHQASSRKATYKVAKPKRR